MIQLGIAAFYHDSAACIVKDGKVIAAVEEERFTEIKHDAAFPVNAIKWCLKEARIKITDIDEVCWYENPETKKDRVNKIFNKRPFTTFFLRKKFLREFKTKNPATLLQTIGYTGRISFVDHHMSHAAFSFLTSPYQSAAILTVDGVGEWETVGIYKGSENGIEKVLSIDFPNSLGMLYSTVTSYLGFKPNEGEYKVMGLAPYGNASKYFDKLDKIFCHSDNKFWIDQRYFTWEYSERIMFNKKFCKLLGLPPRLPEDELTQDHKDLAAALQKIYEREFVRLVKRAKLMTREVNLCLGGGCAYNGVANSLAYDHFDSIHIPFAPSDAGSAIGACLYQYRGERQDNSSPYLGPEYTNFIVQSTLHGYEDKVQWFKLTEEKLIKKTAELLRGQNIIAWFQGRMEFGARALGNRSILASPKDPKMREKLNYVIKKREGFRPFAPSVTEEQADRWFYVQENIPYMNQVVNAKVRDLEAATHVDGSCRVHTVTKKQNPRYHALITELGRIDEKAVVLNTSFNLKDQTITMTPKQAIERFINSEINYLVINNFLIRKI
jgi:carbamoyltransferase